MLRGLLVDFHNTLVAPADLPTWIGQAAAACDGPVDVPEALTDVLGTVWPRALKRYPNGDWDLDPALHRQVFGDVLQEEAGCPPELVEALYACMAEQWVPLPGAVELLEAARAADIRVCLLSNISLDIRSRLREIGLFDLLDDLVLSFEVGVVKPDPEIFRLAASRIGVDPTECLMIGDTPGIDDGAVKTGMTSIIVPVGTASPPLPPIARHLHGW